MKRENSHLLCGLVIRLVHSGILAMHLASFPGSSPAFCCILYIKWYMYAKNAGEDPGNEATSSIVPSLMHIA